LPVFRSSIDQIDGVVYLHELLGLTLAETPSSLDAIVREPLFVPESLHLDAIVERIRREQIQIAIVVDEYGVTAGLLTLEDVVEAVFGELSDRFDEDAPPVRKGRNGTLVVRGDVRLVELEETLGWSPREADSETLGGFVMERLGTVPKVQDTFIEQGRVFRVTAMERNRVAEVTIESLRKPRPSATPPTEAAPPAAVADTAPLPH
jgi:CBS domain containing-hemolysin-like protein